MPKSRGQLKTSTHIENASDVLPGRERKKSLYSQGNLLTEILVYKKIQVQGDLEHSLLAYSTGTSAMIDVPLPVLMSPLGLYR